jgi:hypothetical protein
MESNKVVVILQSAGVLMWAIFWMVTGWNGALIPFFVHALLAIGLMFSTSPTTSEDRQDVQRVDGRTTDGRKQGSDQGNG